MELLKITPSGAIHYKLDDQRIGIVYESGYVRVSTKANLQHMQYYQINKKVKLESKVERELVKNHLDRIKLLVKFNQRNCQTNKNQ